MTLEEKTAAAAKTVAEILNTAKTDEELKGLKRAIGREVLSGLIFGKVSSEAADLIEEAVRNYNPAAK